MLYSFPIESVVALFSCLAALSFVIIYTILAPWWKSSLGQNLIMLATIIAVSTFVYVLRMIFGFDPNDGILIGFRLSILGLILVNMVWRIKILLNVQKLARTIDKEADNE